MSYFDGKDLIFEKDYETGIHEYFEYLLEDDLRANPFREENAKKRFVFQSIFAAICGLVVIYIAAISWLFYLCVIPIIGLLYLVYTNSAKISSSNQKNIQKLYDNAVKRDDFLIERIHLEIYKTDIFLVMDGEQRYINPTDISDCYRTKNLLIIEISDYKKNQNIDIEKIIIPIEVAGEYLENIEYTVTEMAEYSRKVLASLKK